ncbi:hypothetical protein LLH06_07930 [Mucilaginibacter daejeonensis]|uniref:hypothetical protein n=1 Tax=Mucilaginibacter daejeonensis TaxID=398049 RepID=UPI001D17283E|nr:hypothetical protein [Mucilaginibacter daejeonensis]UEG54892.1 hypothetical protein LLH06_07930 [Mucilaginibacter daejeonensis]
MASIEKAYRKASTLKKAAKSLLAFAAMTLVIGKQHVQAQTFAEWFDQKKTQRKYLLQQISALWMYKQYAMKGYNIAKGGLGSIGSYVGKEYGLHESYYTNLKTVNTVVSNDPQVKAILRWQREILEQTAKAKATRGLNQTEKQHVKDACTALLKDCDGQLHDLQIILENDRTEMSDEQRLRQIGRLYDNMQDNYRFAAAMTEEVRLYALQKDKELKDVNTIKKLYGSDK